MVMKTRTPKPEAVPYKELPDDVNDDSPTDVRKKAPFKVGDVVYVKKDGKAKLAQIQYVGVEYLKHGLHWIPRYRVAMLRVDNTFHQRGRLHVYPGDIYRGYQEAGVIPKEEE